MDKKFWSDRARKLVPYVPGEHPQGRKFVKLNTNENPYPPSPKVLEAIRRTATGDLRLYPDPDASALRQAIAERYGLTPEQVFCGNGSDEVLALSFYAFFSPGKRIFFPDITYSFYPVYAQLFGIDFEEIPLNDDFSFPVEKFLGGHGGAVVCNPNAPTGRALPLFDIRRILEANPDVVILVDEAYADFGIQSAVPLLKEYPNLVVVHTMSKALSLAGMRVGYALAAPDLIAAANCVKNSFNSYPIDQLALAAGEAAIRDVDHANRSLAKVMATRDRSTAALRELGFQVYDSNTNFIFITHPDIEAHALQTALRDRGYLVRWFNRPRISNHLRVTIGTDEEMDGMCAACKEILQGG